MICEYCQLEGQPDVEVREYQKFLHVCTKCHERIAVCPECKTKMNLKFIKSLHPTMTSPDFQIYQCPECKNIEVIEQ